MHPMLAHQIAILKADELRREADLYNAHPRVPRASRPHSVRWSAGRIRVALTRMVRTA